MSGRRRSTSSERLRWRAAFCLAAGAAISAVDAGEQIWIDFGRSEAAGLLGLLVGVALLVLGAAGIAGLTNDLALTPFTRCEREMFFVGYAYVFAGVLTVLAWNMLGRTTAASVAMLPAGAIIMAMIGLSYWLWARERDAGHSALRQRRLEQAAASICYFILGPAGYCAYTAGVFGEGLQSILLLVVTIIVSAVAGLRLQAAFLKLWPATVS